MPKTVCPRAAGCVLEDAAEALLLKRCLAHDMRAWDELVSKYEKCVYRFAYSLCKNRDDAADIAGHVFVRVYQNLHTFRHEAGFASWLFRIVRNTHLDLCVRPAYCNSVTLESDLAAESSTGQSPTREIVDPTPSPQTQVIRDEMARLLSYAVKHLPPYQREVLSRYHSQGQSYEEIAESTGISVGTVKSRLNRARANLRERLSPYRDLFVVG